MRSSRSRTPTWFFSMGDKSCAPRQTSVRTSPPCGTVSGTYGPGLKVLPQAVVALGEISSDSRGTALASDALAASAPPGCCGEGMHRLRCCRCSCSLRHGPSNTATGMHARPSCSMTADGGTNPAWNSVFNLRLQDGLYQFQCVIWNANVGRDDIIGSTR